MLTMVVLRQLLFALSIFSVSVDAQRMTYTIRTNNPDIFQTLRGILQNGGQWITEPNFTTSRRRITTGNPSNIFNRNQYQSPIISWQTIINRQQQRRRPQRTQTVQVGHHQSSFHHQPQRFIPQQQPQLALPQQNGVYDSNGLTGIIKQHILDSHNSYRAELGASDMYALIWSDQLSDESLDWAKQCHWGHQKAGRGENLAMISGSSLTLQALVEYGLNGWYNEKHQYDGQDCMSTGSCHYTQMIWSTTREVGCAAHMCPDMYYLVCFYSPPGNIMGVPPYQTGPPCSACVGHCKNNLCH